MKKRLVSILLCVCMVISLMPANTITARAEGGFTGGITAMMSPGETGNIWIFANGKAITIEAKGTGTVIKADNSGTSTEIDLAEVTKDLMNGENPAALTNNGDNGYDLSKTVILGGKNNQQLYFDTSITMNGGIVGALVGGSYAALIQGNTNITINGGTLKGSDIKTESAKSSIHAYFVGGSLGDYGNVSFNNSKPGVVSGEANVTINGGSFDTQFPYYTFGYAGGCSYSSYNSVCSANLFIHGGSFANYTSFYSSIGSKFAGTEAYTSNTGKTPGFYVYCSVSGLAGKINTKDRDQGNNHSSYILTCDEGGLSAYEVDKSHMMVIDAANKTYRFGSGTIDVCLFSDYTIPADYKLQIPEEVTVTVNSRVNVTNNGTIYIKGTLTNNGTISGNGYIFKRAGGAYNVGEGAFPTSDEVQFQIDPIAALTIEKGDIRGTAKITDISAEADCTYYYRVYDSEQVPPKEGDPFNSAEFTVVSINKEFGAYLNDVTAVYEIKDGKVQKYSSVPMTEENLCGPTNYDALDTAIVAKGDGDNTTKITASADTGNALYYKLSGSVQGSGYVYNTIVDSSELTPVDSGADITAEAGKYISVYEMDTNGYLKKFVSVQLTASNFSPYSGGLVADTVNKRIYCNGAKVAYTSTSYDNYCQLYVYADGLWKAAVPRNLDFVSGEGLKEYTLYGGAAADSSEAGTIYILTVRATASAYLPQNVEGFANYIIPDFTRSGANWTERYIVKGDIDLNSCPYGHFWGWNSWGIPCYMQSLTLKDNAQLTLNTGDGPKFIMMGKYTDIVKWENATITNIKQLIFTPYVDIKLFDKDGKEFSKDAVSGKYQIPKDTQVTIAGAISLKGAVALFGDAQQPVSSAPQYIKDPYHEDFTDYSIGFYSNKDHKYYTGNDVDRKVEGTGGNAVKRVQVTLANFNDYSGWNIELRNYNGDTVEGYKYGAIHTSISFDLGKSAILPPAPTNGVVDDTENTFTFTAATGYDMASLYEYSIDGGANWKDCTTFTINVGNIPVTAGNLQVRLKSTDEFNSGNILSSTEAFTAVLEGTASITGNARVGENLTAETQNTQPGAVLHYQWKADGVNIGADKNTYKLTGNDLGKTITVTVTADGYTGALVASATDKVAKGSAQTSNSGNLNISNGQEQVYRFNLKSLLTNGVDFGNVSYSVVVGDATDYYPAVTDSNISDGILNIAVGNVDSSDEKTVGTITIKITSQYYEDMQADININSTNKMVPTTEVTGVFHYVYGEKMSDRDITGSATHDGDPVYGKFVWTSPDYKVNVSDTSAKWSFIPGDTGTYFATEGLADIVVSKATLSGTPLFTAIKEAGKKLSEVALTAPENWPSGSFAWTDSTDTVVAANTAYSWVFTPDDTDNYNVLTGTVTPYPVSSGGNSSGGGHSHGGSSSSTVKQTEPAKQEEKPAQTPTPKSPETVKKDGEEKVKKFKDLKENAWFYEGTVYALGNGWFAGTTENSFSPNNSMTREMFRLVLGRMDADANDLMDNNRLKENITREQLATLLYRMAQEKGLVTTIGNLNKDLPNTASQDTQNISAFADGAQVSSWSKEAMAWANAQGIIQGNDRNMIMPKVGTSRAEVAVMLMRFDTMVKNQ